MLWQKVPVPQDALKDFAEKYGVDLLTASVLLRRGIGADKNILYYLENDKRHLHNPYLLSNMEDAIERILAAKEEGEKVLVYGDRDVDGITGTALLTTWLREAKIDALWRVPKGDEPYGLSLEAVDEAEKNGVTLIITVDCGIVNFREVEYAGSLGIDVVITDHHNPRETLPAACAIVNPKIENSTYPFRNICGCVVAYKLISALRYALFSPSYGAPLCFLNARPSNDAIIIDMIKTKNLVKTGSLSETIIPGAVNISDTRIPEFLQGWQLIVWDAVSQKKMLAKAFGKNVDFNLFDVAPEISSKIPGTEGKSLLRLREVSLLARYAEKPLSELDVFFNLFVTYINRRDKLLGQEDDDCLQLAALGTIADIVPLDNENRIIVKAGLSGMNTKPLPALASLLLKLDMTSKNLTARELAWKFTPAINSAGRMKQAEKAEEWLMAADMKQRDELAGVIAALNEKRKSIGDEVWEKALPEAEKNLEFFNGKLAAAGWGEGGGGIPRGVTGIIANRLAARLKTPALVISVENGMATGSFRSPRFYKLGGLLEACADLFSDYGGHDFAAGFNMELKNSPKLRERLKNFSAAIEFESGGEEDAINIDCELPLSYLSPDIFKLVDLFEPYGESNEQLAFLSRGLMLCELSFIGSGASHIRCILDTGRYKWPAVYWNAAAKAGVDFSNNSKVDAVFNVTRDYYGGKEKAQLVIQDMKTSSAQ